MRKMLRALQTPMAQGQLARPSVRILPRAANRVRIDRVHATKLNARSYRALHIVGFRLRDSERNAGDEGWQISEITEDTAGAAAAAAPSQKKKAAALLMISI